MNQGIDLRREHRVTVFLAAGILAGLVVYAAVVEIIRHQGMALTRDLPFAIERLRDGFLVAALAVFLGVRLVRKSLLKQGQGESIRTLANRFRMVTIVTYALCEIPAILGLVLYFLGGLYREFYGLLFYSLLLMVIYFPRYDHWAAWIGRGYAVY
jgi:hypothetical protein